MRPPRFKAVTVAVRGSLGRRSNLENRERALSSPNAKGTHPIRDGNLSRALTTPHLHLPSRRRTE